MARGGNARRIFHLSPMPDMPPQFHVASQTVDDTTHMRLVMQSPQAFAAEVGEKALSLSFVFMEDMEDGHPEMYRVSALSKDAGGKVDGIVVMPPAGVQFLISDYTPGKDEYSGLIKDNKFAAVFTGVAHPIYIDA